MIRAFKSLVLWCTLTLLAAAQHTHMQMPAMNDGLSPNHFFHTMALPGGTATMTSSGSATGEETQVSSFADAVTTNYFFGSSAAPFVAAQVFSTNGITLAIDSNHNGYQLKDYDTGAYGWVKQAEWGTVYGLQADGQGNIWGLESQKDSYCASIGGGHAIGLWNGSSWTLETYCFTQFFMSQDGSSSILSIDANGTLWTNVGGWQHAAMPTGAYPILSATWITDGHYMVVGHDNKIWQFNGTTFVQPTNGGCCALSIASDNQGTFYAIGMDNNLYHYNGNGYDKLVGPGAFSGVTNGGSGFVWAVGPTKGGNSVYRFSDLAMRYTRKANGNITCTPIPPFNESVCNGFTHSISWQVGIDGVYGNQFAYSFTGPNSWNATAYADHELFSELENFGNNFGNVSVAGTVMCSGVGQLFNDAFSKPKSDWEIAFTKSVWTTAPPVNCHTGASGVTWCNFPQVDACDTALTPDHSMTGENIHSTTSSMEAFPVANTMAFCSTQNVDSSGHGHQPWACTYGTSWGWSRDPLATGFCTSHP